MNKLRHVQLQGRRSHYQSKAELKRAEKLAAVPVILSVNIKTEGNIFSTLLLALVSICIVYRHMMEKSQIFF